MNERFQANTKLYLFIEERVELRAVRKINVLDRDRLDISLDQHPGSGFVIVEKHSPKNKVFPS